MTELQELMKDIDQFADDRNWGQFHSPKNLSMALVVEAGELVEQFQWLTERESESLNPERHQKVQEEIADVLIYSLRMCSRMDIDPFKAVKEKIAANGRRYPVEFAKGNAKKSTDRP